MTSSTFKILLTAGIIASGSVAIAQTAPNGGPSTSQRFGAQSTGGAQGGRPAETGAIGLRGGDSSYATPNGGPSTSQRAGSQGSGGAQGSVPVPAPR